MKLLLIMFLNLWYFTAVACVIKCYMLGLEVGRAVWLHVSAGRLMRHILHLRHGLIRCALAAQKQNRTAATFGYFDQCGYLKTPIFFGWARHSFRFRSCVAEKAAEQYWRQAAAQSGLGEDRYIQCGTIMQQRWYQVNGWHFMRSCDTGRHVIVYVLLFQMLFWKPFFSPRNGGFWMPERRPKNLANCKESKRWRIDLQSQLCNSQTSPLYRGKESHLLTKWEVA